MAFYAQFLKDHLIFAHRGVRSEAPENTLLAFEKGLGRTDAFEIDVQLTRDGVPVVVHDASLKRTTDILFHPSLYRCKQWKVHQFTLEELRSLDAGSWYLNQDPFGFLEEVKVDIHELSRAMPQRIPTLQEVLDFAKKHAYPLNIELKMHKQTPIEEFVESVLHVIDASDCASLLLISSFDHELLARIKKKAPFLATAALMEVLPDEPLVPYLQALHVEALHVKHTLVESLPLKELAQADIVVSVFTVNDPRYMEMLFDLGIKGVFSDVATY